MRKKVTVLTILVICWMALIFWFSNQEGDDSQNLSDSIVTYLVESLNLAKEKSELEKTELIGQLGRVERKLAHYGIYLIGGVLIYADVKAIAKLKNAKPKDKTVTQSIDTANTDKKTTIQNSNKIKYAIIALITGATYAGTDEIHQLFMDGRSGAIADVILDTIGIATGITLYMLVSEIRCRNKKVGD